MEDTFSQSNQDTSVYTGGRKNTTTIWVGVAMMAALLGLAGGLGLGALLVGSGESTTDGASSAEVAQLEEQVQQLQSDLDAKTSEALTLGEDLREAAALEADLHRQLAESGALDAASPNQSEVGLKDTVDDLHQQLQDALAQLEASQDGAGFSEIRERADLVEKHRLLLVEMRRDIPVTREDARDYWSNLKSIAADADPSLVTPIDRIILRIDNYFDWDERQPSLQVSVDDEYLAWLESYGLSGASEYSAYVDVFTKDAMLAIINQLDSIVTQLE